MEKWQEDLVREPCFAHRNRAHSLDGYNNLMDARKEAIEKGIQQKKFTVVDVAEFLLKDYVSHTFIVPHNYPGDIFYVIRDFVCYKDIKSLWKCFTELKVTCADEFAKAFKELLGNDTVNPNEVLQYFMNTADEEVVYLDVFSNRSWNMFHEFCECKDFDANAAVKNLYKGIKEACAGFMEDDFWDTTAADEFFSEPKVTDLSFLVPDLKEACENGDERIIQYFRSFVDKGTITLEEAKDLADQLRENYPELIENYDLCEF